MRGLSLLATTISVISFPLVFLALLYPGIASPRWGRWGGFFLYLGVSLAGLLIAAFSSPGPNVPDEKWQVTDWVVLLVGGGGLLTYLTRTWWRPPPATPHMSPSEPRPGKRKGNGSRRKGSYRGD